MKKTFVISAGLCLWVISAPAQMVCPVNSMDDLASPQSAPNQSGIAITGTESSVISLSIANPNQLGLREELGISPIEPMSTFDFTDTDTVPKYNAHVPEPPSLIAAIALLIPLSASFLRVLRKKEVS